MSRAEGVSAPGCSHLLASATGPMPLGRSQVPQALTNGDVSPWGSGITGSGTFSLHPALCHTPFCQPRPLWKREALGTTLAIPRAPSLYPGRVTECRYENKMGLGTPDVEVHTRAVPACILRAISTQAQMCTPRGHNSTPQCRPIHQQIAVYVHIYTVEVDVHM